MASWFYTDTEAQQQGPVGGEKLLELSNGGRIHADSLVWKEGLEEWIPFRDVAASLFGSDDDGRPIEIGVCAYSQQIYPVSEMIPYGEAVIGLEHKDAFMQRLMESGTVEIADASGKRFEFVGFWWRVLSSFLDYLIKMIPSWICMIPYYVVLFTGGIDSLEGGDPGTGTVIGMAVAYGFGLLGMLAVSIFYETWMVGKYQATLGKMIIGARVVNPDGSRLTYKRAFIRWLAKKPLNYVIVWLPCTVAVALVMGGIAQAADQSDGGAAFGLAFVTALLVFFAVLAICLGVYWMAAFDEEKRTLHDRIASTRVVRK